MIAKKNSLPELPKGWVWTTLEEIGEIITGTTPSKSKKEYYGRDFPFFKPTDLNDGYYVRKSQDGLSKKGIEKARLLPAKSILVTCIGATIGKTGFIRVEGATNQQINSIIPEKHIFPEFIYFICISLQFQKSIIDNASATTLPILNKSKFEILEIPLPPLPEQQRIVAKIDEFFTKLDAGVEALKKVKAQLNRHRHAVLKYAFEGKLTEKWRETHKGELESALVLLERTKEEGKKNVKGKFKDLPLVNTTDLFELPDSWVWTTIGEIVTFEYGKGLRKDKRNLNGNIPVYGSNGIVGYHSIPLVDKTCLIVGRKGAAGQVHISNSPCWPIDTTYYVIPPEGIDLTFLFYLFLTLGLAFLDKSTAIPGLNRNDAYVLPIPLPSPPEQHKIVEEIECRFSVADEVERVVEQSLKQAERLRQSILKKAFEGKLVPQDPSDEPAEKLLERIKTEKEKRKAEEKIKKRRKRKINMKQRS